MWALPTGTNVNPDNLYTNENCSRNQLSESMGLEKYMHASVRILADENLEQQASDYGFLLNVHSVPR
jgi:hypothetical protein